ncbi:MAG: hypothetical protein KDA91_07245 [Planctomycetaceae bacterium]|nr:hypothetical protein [Planctomycetaceae bacterium]
MPNTLFIGTDEAGYGPNLGPLVITATSWQAPSGTACDKLWDLLAEVLTNDPAKDDRRLFVADSKQVYSPASGILDLETAVLSFLSALNLQPATTAELGAIVAGSLFDEQRKRDPTLATAGTPLPLAAFPDEVAESREAILNAFRQTQVRLVAIRSRIIFPPEFNELVSRAGSKGVILSQSTMDLVHQLCPKQFHSHHTEDLRRGPKRLFALEDDEATVSSPTAAETGENIDSVHVYCDKHGGRNRYDALISEQFDDQFVFRREESTAISRYQMGKVEFCFRTKAEALLPVALASMVSKYVRECLMEDFNAFWRNHLPTLKPTRGYPLDARRFREDIASAVMQLGIEESHFWRCK